MDGQLDNHYVNWYESKHKDARFVRVDSNVMTSSSRKTKRSSVPEQGPAEIMRPVFESQMPKDRRSTTTFRSKRWRPMLRPW